MLRQRIITGIIIAPIALAGVFLLPPAGFALFVGAVLTVAAWEWANLAGLSGALRLVYAAVMAAAIFGVYFLPPVPVLLVSLLWWAIALVLVPGYPRFRELWGNQAVIVIIGFLVMLPAFSALNRVSQFPQSDFLICLLFFLIWGADIGAYFSGKAFGKRKLMPRVSPGKSRAGFYGGIATSGVIAALMALYPGGPVLMSRAGLAYLAACMGIAAVSVLGDLTISMFKRHRDIKDSSNLLPGHGGFLDRIDSLLSASPVFALYLLFASWPRDI